MNKEVKATPENYLELMDALSVREVLGLASAITGRLVELKIENDGYWLEKPSKFSEYWIPALNGTLDESYLEVEDE
jgi:hypothetical protein